MPSPSPVLLSIVVAASALLVGCVQDADTVLEPDPVRGDAGGGGPEVDARVGPAIEVDPPMLALAGQGSIAPLTIRNGGQAPLRIERVLRDGSPGFAAVHAGQNALIVGADALTGPDGLAPGASLVIEVEALVGPPATARLVIVSNDPVRPEVAVDVGFAAADCLRAEPGAIDFGDVALGAMAVQVARVFNCGPRPVEVHEVALAAETDPGFALSEPLALGPVAAGGFVDVRVAYEARVEGPAIGRLRVAGAAVALDIPLSARSRADACPVAQVRDGLQRVEVGDVVVLDGSASIDPDAADRQPVAWRWTVVERPAGSTEVPRESFFDPARPELGGLDDDPATPTAVMSIDRAGRYVVELEVVGGEGCVDRLQAVVEACPCGDDGFVIELNWETPGVEPHAGVGADLDLHLLHPIAAAWFSRPYDCHYAEPSPDWGQLGNPDDDPTLDVDRIGVGPERIRLGMPEDTGVLGAPYLVGVEHRGLRLDSGEPPVQSVEATVRVHVDGVLAIEVTTRLEPSHFWDVLALEWPEGRVEVRDRLYDQRP